MMQQLGLQASYMRYAPCYLSVSVSASILQCLTVLHLEIVHCNPVFVWLCKPIVHAKSCHHNIVSAVEQVAAWLVYMHVAGCWFNLMNPLSSAYRMESKVLRQSMYSLQSTMRRGKSRQEMFSPELSSGSAN